MRNLADRTGLAGEGEQLGHVGDCLPRRWQAQVGRRLQAGWSHKHVYISGKKGKDVFQTLLERATKEIQDNKEKLEGKQNAIDGAYVEVANAAKLAACEEARKAMRDKQSARKRRSVGSLAEVEATPPPKRPASGSPSAGSGGVVFQGPVGNTV